MTDEPFLAAIAATPDDPGPYSVYGDALQQRGDPRGELIAVQTALETASIVDAAELRRREGQALWDHEAVWLGEIANHREAIAFRWRYGFVHAARVIHPDVGALDALLAHAPALAELWLGPPLTGEPCEPLGPLVERLSARWPTALRRLRVHDRGIVALHAAPAIALHGLDAHPLDELVVAGAAIELGWRTSPRGLRRLMLASPKLGPNELDIPWPALESLTVWWPQPVAGLVDVLTPSRFPRLRELAIVGTADTDHECAAIAELSLLAQLGRLEVSGGTLTAEGARVLEPLAGRLQLDVRRNLLTRATRTRLSKLGAVVEPQRTGTRSLSDIEEQAQLAQQVATLASRLRRKPTEDAPDPAIAMFEKLVRMGEHCAPEVAFDARQRCAPRLPKRERRGACVALAAEQATVLWWHRGELLYAIGNLCDELHEPHAAEAWLWQAANDARWCRYQRLEHQALGQIATLRIRRGDPEIAAPILARVASYYERTTDRAGEAWARRQQGNVELVRSDFARAETFYQRALEMYRAAGDNGSEGIVLSELSSVLWSRQDYTGAENMLRESIAMREPGSLGLGSAHYNLGAILNGAGRIDEAIAAAEESLRVFREHRHTGGEAQALSLLGELMQRTHQHEQAKLLLEQSLARSRELGAKREQGITLGNLSRVALDLGAYAEARTYCEEAIELHRDVGNRFNEGLQLLGLVDAAIGEHQLDTALARAEEALVPLVAIANYPAIASIRMRRGWVAQLRGDHAAAEEQYRLSNADAERGSHAELLSWTRLWTALMRAKEHQPDAATIALDAAQVVLGRTVEGRESHAMATALVARLAGHKEDAPSPRSFNARILIALAGAQLGH